MCHFHQKRIIQRYLTKNPKLQASKDLWKIVVTLAKTNELNFKKKLDLWYNKYKNFVEEQTINNDTGKFYFTHYKVRAAYKSLKSNLSYLFTHKKYSVLGIHNTTNSLDGGTFSYMNIHRGFSKSLKLKIVDDFLVSYSKSD